MIHILHVVTPNRHSGEIRRTSERPQCIERSLTSQKYGAMRYGLTEGSPHHWYTRRDGRITVRVTTLVERHLKEIDVG